MGLDTTHNCWHGPYSAFNRWRVKVCEVSGYGNLYDYHGFGGYIPWPDDDPLTILLYHSDCEGEIQWEDCIPIAERLESLLPALKIAGGDFDSCEEKTQLFINGLRFASEAKENVIFH